MTDTILDLSQQRPGRWRRLADRARRWLAPSESLEPILEEQFNRVRHAILFHPRLKDVRSILVTSALDGEGKTTVATGLARSFARSLDHSALLVETDLRRPKLAALFGVPEGPGLIGHMIDAAPLARAVQQTPVPKLAVLPAGGRLDAAANLVGSRFMRQFMDEVRAAFPERIVVYDAPPILATPEPLSLSQVVDGIVLVVGAESTPRELVRQALRALPQEKLIGIVFNRVLLNKRERRYLGSYYSASAAEERDEALA
jgi:capsular exopolysaccharide synthesis family protein